MFYPKSTRCTRISTRSACTEEHGSLLHALLAQELADDFSLLIWLPFVDTSVSGGSLSYICVAEEMFTRLTDDFYDRMHHYLLASLCENCQVVSGEK